MRKTTPVTRDGLTQYDHLPPLEAILAAWNTPGDKPHWHRERQQDVRRMMPVLARALDRATQEGPTR